MTYGKTLKIYVMGKDPRSLKSVELSNWSGQAFIGRREHMPLVKKRSELGEPAVYLLLGDTSEDGAAIDIYIGETDSFSDRLANHVQSKDYWSHFVAFVSKDKNLTKAHVKHLERQLFLLAKKSIGTLALKNSSEPSGSSLPESDIAAMSEFLENIIFVLETLGLSYFPNQLQESSELERKSSQQASSTENLISEGMEFYITLPKISSQSGTFQPKAFMTIKDGVYILKAGSHIKSKPRDSFEGHSYHKIWNQIVKSDAVKSSSHDGIVITTRDIDFQSPSGAGAIARGGQTNGRTDWKRVSDDKSLGDCESESI